MKIEKAVITAAGPGQSDLPLQTLVDSDGHSRSALEILLREVRESGVNDIGLVIHPRDESAYRAAAGAEAEGVQFVPQAEPLGYGHAVYQARAFTGDDPFLHLVGDHLYVSNAPQRCARQLMDLAELEDCSVSAVQSTRETNLSLYGAVGGTRLSGRSGCYQVERVLEKPTPTQAEQELVVPGLRAGHYLCFFGMHVLTPGVMEALGLLLQEAAAPREISLSRALDALVRSEKILACEVSGDRQNIGIPYGLFYAQLALALRGVDREKVLSHLAVHLAEFRGHVA